MNAEKTVTLRPYDREAAEDVFHYVFASGIDGENGLKECPAAALQLLVSALEYIRWDVHDQAGRQALKQTIGIVEGLRDQQQRREWNRM